MPGSLPFHDILSFEKSVPRNSHIVSLKVAKYLNSIYFIHFSNWITSIKEKLSTIKYWIFLRYICIDRKGMISA